MDEGGSIPKKRRATSRTRAVRSALLFLLVLSPVALLAAINVSRAFLIEEVPLPNALVSSKEDSLHCTKEAVREPTPRPPLASIVQDWNITGDPSWLLNLAVIGFPKCGTTTLMLHLESHPEVQMFTKERCDLGLNRRLR